MKKVFNTIWKSLVVGAGYTAALMIGGMIVPLVGLSLPEVEEPLAGLMWAFVGGIIAGLCLGPIASSIPASRTRHFMIWGSVIFFNLLSVTVEGRFFAPDLVGDSLTGLVIQQILAALATSWLITTLFTVKETAMTSARAPRRLFSWVWRFFTSAFSYLLFYFIFGAINYALVTRPYYETHAGGLTVPPLGTVLTAELIRGILIVLSVIPFLLTHRAKKTRLAVFTGLILFSIGGLVPLTMQANALPLILLAASAVEIFFQNFSTGMVTAFLLGQPAE